MGATEKDILEHLQNGFSNLDNENKSYVMGVIDGMALGKKEGVVSAKNELEQNSAET